MYSISEQVVRLAINFNLVGSDLLSRALPLDFGPGLVFLEINYQNLRGQSAPEDPRRPVSAYRLARNLHLPYETCRRYANQLVQAGWCERLERGFIAVTKGPGERTVAAAVPLVWNAVGDYVRALQVAGLDLPEGGGGSSFNVQPRVAVEASLHFLNLLRVGCEIFSLDAMDVLLIYAVLNANTAHVTERLQAVRLAADTGAPIPDSQRRPVSAYRLAQEMRAPYETVRRHVRRLVEAGHLVDAADGGVYAPARAYDRPEIRQGITTIVAEVKRFLTALSVITPLPLSELASDQAAPAPRARLG